ncbi:BPI fold-containing family A member 2-like [Acomys russatus]|uniref:BPI fold-containing family A member 2-like n=1 Tax=Acomys russatus TaxID=60746 RepID=UPI0021E2CEFC|nr:BPI fold-containing family A member 2-like [Acomys russatus]
MFQFVSLVVTFGLIIGTSESLLNNALSSLNNLKVLGSDPGKILNSPSGDDLQKVNLDVGSLQKDSDWLSAKNSIVETVNSQGVGKLNHVSPLNGLGLKINEFRLLDLKADLSSDGKGINLRMPLAMSGTVSIPLLGPLVDVAISLDLIIPVSIQTNAQTGLPMVVAGKCSMSADKISISLLGRRSSTINTITDNLSAVVTKLVSYLLQNQICPLLQFILSHLNVTLTQDLLYTEEEDKPADLPKRNLHLPGNSVLSTQPHLQMPLLSTPDDRSRGLTSP